jgi:hypothetical protein
MKFSRSQEDVRKYLFLFNFLFNHKEQTMKYRSSWYRSVLAGIALLAGLGLHSTVAFGQAATSQYLAGGTFTNGAGTGQVSANTDVTNQATLSYTISSTAQPNILSNQVMFKVDNLVRVVVAATDTNHTVVAPGALAQVTTFTVTNTGNAIQDYKLDAGNLATAQTLIYGAITYTDSFDGTSCQAYVETNATAGYQAGADINQTLVSLAPNASRTVYVVCNIPPAPGLTAGDAIVSLTATTYDATSCGAATGVCGAGTLTLQIGGADNQAAVDVVFADTLAASPAVPGDAARDGKHAAVDVYRIANAIVTVAKTVTTLCDTFNFTTNPKAIPGSYVKYSIAITNSAAATASATLSTITDTLNANLNFDTNLITGNATTCDATTPESAGNAFKLTCAGTAGRTCTTAQFYTSGSAAISIAGALITANLATALPAVGVATCPNVGTPSAVNTYCAGELKPGETVTIFFNAIVK